MDGYPFELDNFDPSEDSITSEIVEPVFTITDRSLARRASLQILYEIDTTQHPLDTVLETHLSERPESYALRRIINQIVRGVAAHREAIDRLIEEYAPDWPVEQVAVIDRNILRIAIFEHEIQKRQTPTAVIINEAVHLAEAFGAQNSQSFVHGVLGGLTAADAVPAVPDDEEDDAR